MEVFDDTFKMIRELQYESAFGSQRLTTVNIAHTQELVRELIFYFEKNRIPSTWATYWVTNSIVILITLKFRYY